MFQLEDLGVMLHGQRAAPRAFKHKRPITASGQPGQRGGHSPGQPNLMEECMSGEATLKEKIRLLLRGPYIGGNCSISCISKPIV